PRFSRDWSSDVCSSDLLGAGNIIFPPMVGLGSGPNLWWAALGFLLTGVGLPVLAIVTLARVGGGLEMLTSPIGRVAGTAFGVARSGGRRAGKGRRPAAR